MYQKKVRKMIGKGILNGSPFTYDPPRNNKVLLWKNKLRIRQALLPESEMLFTHPKGNQKWNMKFTFIEDL